MQPTCSELVFCASDRHAHIVPVTRSSDPSDGVILTPLGIQMGSFK